MPLITEEELLEEEKIRASKTGTGYHKKQKEIKDVLEAFSLSAKLVDRANPDIPLLLFAEINPKLRQTLESFDDQKNDLRKLNEVLARVLED